MVSIFHKELERKVENKKLIDEDGGHEALDQNQIRTSSGDPIENWAYRISPHDQFTFISLLYHKNKGWWDGRGA